MIILDGVSKPQTMGGLKGSYADTTRRGVMLGSVKQIRPGSSECEPIKRALAAGLRFAPLDVIPED